MSVTSSGTATPSEQVLRDVEIHGGVNNWYLDVKAPPHTYRLEIGYLAASKKFYSLARSNVVTTPSAGDGLRVLGLAVGARLARVAEGEIDRRHEHGRNGQRSRLGRDGAHAIARSAHRVPC